MTSILQFREELVALGPEWEARIYIIGSLIGIGMIAYITYQVGNGCATTGSLLVSTFIAILTGALISFQNRMFLGKESINVLGLPFLDERVQTGAPLYVCSKKEESTGKDTCK
jgi:phosphate/sulfate permease